MTAPRNRPGRPPTGTRYTERTSVYLTPEDKQLLRRVADRLGVSDAEVVRRGIHAIAQQEDVK